MSLSLGLWLWMELRRYGSRGVTSRRSLRSGVWFITTERPLSAADRHSQLRRRPRTMTKNENLERDMRPANIKGKNLTRDTWITCSDNPMTYLTHVKYIKLRRGAQKSKKKCIFLLHSESLEWPVTGCTTGVRFPAHTILFYVYTGWNPHRLLPYGHRVSFPMSKLKSRLHLVSYPRMSATLHPNNRHTCTVWR